MMNYRIQLYYKPYENVVIDETIAHFKGRAHHCKVYLKDKPYKWGIKFYTLADSQTHYTYKTLIHFKDMTFPIQI